MPSAAAAVPREAGDLGLMHRVDHGGRGAGAPEYVADFDHIADAGALAAEFARNRNAHQALGARLGDRLGREARVAIDNSGVFRRNRSDLLGASEQARRVGRCSRGRLAAHGSSPARNPLQCRSSQIDGCVHDGLNRIPASAAIPAGTRTAKFQIHRDFCRELSRFFRIKVTDRKQLTR